MSKRTRTKDDKLDNELDEELDIELNDAQEDEALGEWLLDEALNGTLDDVKAALVAGADVKYVDSTGVIALMKACMRPPEQGEEALAIVRYLVEECSTSVMLRVVNDDSWTCLHYAAYYGSLELVQYLLEKVPAIVNTRDHKGQSALFDACFRCDHNGIEIVQALLDAGAKIDICDEDADSSLHYACQFSTAEMVDLLLSHGADIDAIGSAGSPIFDAVRNIEHGAAIINLLDSRGANLTLRNEDGTSLPDYAMISGSPSVIAALVPLIPSVKLRREVCVVNEENRWNFVGKIREARSWGADSVSSRSVAGSSDEIWCMMRAKKDIDVGAIRATLR